MTSPAPKPQETPRTDAAIRGVLNVERAHMSCLISVARQLERELSTALLESERLRRERDEAYAARDEATTLSLKEVDSRMQAEQSLAQARAALWATRAYDEHRWNCKIGEDLHCRQCSDLMRAAVNQRVEAIGAAAIQAAQEGERK